MFFKIFLPREGGAERNFRKIFNAFAGFSLKNLKFREDIPEK